MLYQTANYLLDFYSKHRVDGLSSLELQYLVNKIPANDRSSFVSISIVNHRPDRKASFPLRRYF